MLAYAYHSGFMPSRTADPFSLAQIAHRLRITRAALGYTQPMMSSLAGLSTEATAWSNYELGIRRISLDVVQQLHTRLGITLHWIYRGDIDGLPPHLREKIEAEIRDEARKSPR